MVIIYFGENYIMPTTVGEAARVFNCIEGFTPINPNMFEIAIIVREASERVSAMGLKAELIVEIVNEAVRLNDF